MSLFKMFSNLFHPVASALSMCCPLTFCQVGENQPTLDDSASISTSSSFYSPISPPSLPSMRPISLAASSISSNFNNSPNQSPVLTSRSSPGLLTHPFYVVVNQDILYIMFRLMDPITLTRCARVCKLWWELATSAFWMEHALSIGMHPLLGYMDTFYLGPPIHPVSALVVPKCTL